MPEIDVFSSSVTDKNLLKALRDFEQMRKTIKSPMTDKAKELLLGKLAKLSTDTDVQIAILNQSIFRGWKGVFEVKELNQAQEGSQYGQLGDFV